MKSSIALFAVGSLMLAAGCSTARMHTQTMSAGLNSQEVHQLAQIAPCMVVGGGEEVTLSAEGLFKKGRSKLSKAGRAEVDSLAAILVKYPHQTMTLSVYADNLGSAEKALKFTQRRADALQGELVKQGIVAAQITAVGKGNVEPVAMNDTPEGQAKNRRAELVIMP